MMFRVEVNSEDGKSYQIKLSIFAVSVLVLFQQYNEIPEGIFFVKKLGWPVILEVQDRPSDFAKSLDSDFLWASYQGAQSIIPQKTWSNFIVCVFLGFMKLSGVLMGYAS